jgi:hypothetical protein
MDILLRPLQRLLRFVFNTRVTFPDGSYVEFYHREAVLYVEPGVGEMEIYWTYASGMRRGRTLKLSDIGVWRAPNEGRPVTQQKRDEILLKVEEYCRRRHIRLRIVE